MSDQPAKQEVKCPECGNPILPGWPHGLCSTCALGGALEDLSESSTVSGDVTTAFPRRFGDYELLEEIARGGMGIVYRARQTSLDRIVAVKMILAGEFALPEFIQRFKEEAAAAASLQHPNIVSIHEIGECDGRNFFSMDYVEGKNLAETTRNGPLPARQAAEMAFLISQAVEHAHTRGILHRDLKPSNVLIDPFGQPQITDFGLAKRIDGSASGTDFLTLTGQVLGSPNYLPPEQASGRRGKTDRRSDVYSLGAILYHLLTGRPPFSAGTLADTLEQVQHTDPAPPRTLNPSVPPDLETICLKCLEKEPSRRYTTAHELTEELGRFLAHQPIRARPIGIAGRAGRWCRRNPGLAGLTALAAGLLAVIAIGSSIAAWQIRRSKIELARNLYAADIKLAEVAVSEGNIGRARALLKAYENPASSVDFRSFEWGYLRRVTRGEQTLSLQAHQASIGAVAFTPDGKTVASAGFDAEVKFWDFPSMKYKYSLVLPGEMFNSLAFSPDGTHLAATRRGQGLSVWRMEDRKQLLTLTGNYVNVEFNPRDSSLATAQGLLMPGSSTGSIKIWADLEDKQPRTFAEVGDRFTWSSDGSTFFAGPVEGEIRGHESKSGKVLKRFSTPPDLLKLVCSPDNRLLAAAYHSGHVLLWQVDTAELLHDISAHPATVWSAAFSPDSRHLATASSDRTVVLWDATTGERERTLTGHANEVWAVAFSKDGKTLVSGDKDGAIHHWKLDLDSSKDSMPPIPEIDPPLVFSPDGKIAAVGISSRSIGLFETSTGRLLKKLPEADFALGFSPDGQKLLALEWHEIVEFNLLTFERRSLRNLVGDAPNTTFAAIAPDQKTLALGDDSGRLSLWNVADGRLVDSTRLDRGSNSSWFVFSPDGRALAATRWDVPSAWIFTDGLKHLTRLEGHQLYVWSAAFSQNGDYIATASVDDTVKIWDRATGKNIRTLSGHNEGAYGVAFSPENRTLAAACGNGKVKLWNVETGREMTTIENRSPGLYLNFSPDGRTLVGFYPWGSNARIKFWSADLPAPIHH